MSLTKLRPSGAFFDMLRLMEGARHLHAVIPDTEQPVIEQGIRDAMEAGRIAPDVGAASIAAYRRSLRSFMYPNVVELPRQAVDPTPDTAA